MQAETGRSAATSRSSSSTSTDLINFYGTQGGEVHRRGNGPAALAAARLEEAQRPVPAPPGGRRHQPLELPAGDGARRRDPGPAGRRRGRRQALRVHAAGPDRGDRGLEAGDRRPRRLRLRPRHRRGRRRTWSTTSTSSSSPAPTGPGRKVMARAAETLTPVSLELGGKDPMIVLADADVDRAANAAAWGGDVQLRARSASRSSGSTSRSPSTTSSSPS